MAIWTYAETTTDDLVRAYESAALGGCLYCDGKLENRIATLPQAWDDPENPVGYAALARTLDWCPTCGWWCISQETSLDGGPGREQVFAAAASLRNLDLTDISTPIEEIRNHIVAKRDGMIGASPKLFEELVASVFRDHGHSVIVTGRTGDGGIDAVLEGKNGRRVGVQVKRYKKANKIEVEQIRGFLGAMVLKDMKHGIFVTTSSFRSGARAATREAKIRGYRIKLLNGDEFFQELRIAQRSAYSEDELDRLANSRLYGRVKLTYLHTREALAEEEGEENDSARDRPKGEQ